MNIDWFTFVAQIVNFLILVGLLRWLLYDPVVNAMKQREQKVTDRLEVAREMKQDAEQRIEQYEKKVQEIEEQRQQLLEEARQKADERCRELLAEARESIEEKREQWLESIRRDQEDLAGGMRQAIGHLGVEAARQTLTQLADQSLETNMCDQLAMHLQQLDDSQRQSLSEPLENGDVNVAVVSHFKLADEQRDTLRNALQQTLDYDGPVEFETSPDVVCGLRLDIGGHSFDWNFEEFLREMDRRINEALESGTNGSDP